MLNQEVGLHPVESLTLPPSLLQLLLAVGELPLLLPDAPLVVVINVLQLLIGALKHLSNTNTNTQMIVTN